VWLGLGCDWNLEMEGGVGDLMMGWNLIYGTLNVLLAKKEAVNLRTFLGGVPNSKT